MASLSNPVNSQNIIDRFADYVVASGNSSISWGTNALPFGEFPAGYFGGDTGGKGIEISGGNLSNPISAANIFNTLVAETNRYTRIRNLRALRYVSGYGYDIDWTAKANMNTDYLQSIPASSNIAAGDTITTSALETLFDNLRYWYNSAAANTVTIQIDVCHSSCHSSCHGSRGRR